MKRKHCKEPDSIALDLPGAKDISLRVVIGREDGAPNFTMLFLEIASGGSGPSHAHPWEELMFVKTGTGEVKSDNETQPVGPGTTVFFAPNEPHQFLNTGSEPLEFLSIMPHRV
jgi:quercetin dioxygenase-like cupin family protein